MDSLWNAVEYPLISDSKSISITYSSLKSVEEICSYLEKTFTPSELEEITGDVCTQPSSYTISRIPLNQLILRMQHPNYLKIIDGKLFESHIQPIVNSSEGNVFGYEFLLRSRVEQYPFYPGELFSFAQRSGLQSKLDSQCRINAIRTSSELLGQGIKRFINFLPSSIYEPEHCLKTTFQAVEMYRITSTTAKLRKDGS
ncbi:EAL domain-containing protein [Evansella tamaricis]|uniref:EAL domain-containing protein n=1 Tax=Evansella tamaricis TaxID=2069301 RepID=A0ABS6JG81_9BACI|nr:EAL domain-containing protein [Evansella tamaricis]MBU9711440.1 EAL domain-containing protein [Evansella tamaricis]